ncbi:MAG: macro domain-containing protein [Erysipelotrichaceae bacterium]|nr:macro domain-containing protein [Erysipelotrichaceae bacterium]
MKNIAINQEWEPENLNNFDIENSVLTLEADHTQENIKSLISIFKRSVQDGKMLFVPVMENYEAKTGNSMFSTEKLDIGALMGEPEKKREGIPKKVQLLSGDLAFTAFTSRKELDKGQPTKFTAVYMKEFFEMALEDGECSGIVINPWDVSVLLDKTLLMTILEEDEILPHKGSLYVDLGDILTAHTDALVVNVTTNLEPISLLGQRIFNEAGETLKEALAEKGTCHIGDAMILKTPTSHAKYLILTTPAIYSGSEEDITDLMRCYWNALELAAAYGLHTIAFSASSLDNGGFPIDEAARISVMSCSKWIVEHPDYSIAVDLVCENDETQKAFMNFVKGVNPEEEID